MYIIWGTQNVYSWEMGNKIFKLVNSAVTRV